MKPSVSIIPEPDLSTEVRDVSAARRRKIIASQNGICKRANCEAPATAVDHITPLWLYGSNRDDNLEGLCGPCHARKTKAEAAVRAKVLAQGGMTGQRARRLKNGPQIKTGRKLQTHGFGGGPTAKQLRSQADDR